MISGSNVVMGSKSPLALLGLDAMMHLVLSGMLGPNNMLASKMVPATDFH